MKPIALKLTAIIVMAMAVSAPQESFAYDPCQRATDIKIEKYLAFTRWEANNTHNGNIVWNAKGERLWNEYALASRYATSVCY